MRDACRQLRRYGHVPKWYNVGMKTLTLFLAAAVSLSVVAAPLRFLSFNIWGDYFNNPVAERQDGVAAIIRGHRPDLVSLQEVTPGWWNGTLFADLKAAGLETLRGDETNALLRAGAPKNTATWPKKYVNHEPLCYNPRRLKLLDQGLDFYHLHLQVEKSVTWGVFEDRESGRRFMAFATHFWWMSNGKESDMLRELNARHILDRVADVRKKWGADLPVIGGGDLNTRPGSWAYEAFRDAGWENAAASADVKSPICSHHGDPKRGADGKYRGFQNPKCNLASNSIDHVFFTPKGIHALKHDIDVSQPALDVSDHSPVVVDFELK